MTIEQLGEAVHAGPFRPLKLSLADGRRLRGRRPEYIFLPPKAQRTFIVAQSGEVYSIIDLPGVTSINFNGRTRSRSKTARRARLTASPSPQPFGDPLPA